MGTTLATKQDLLPLATREDLLATKQDLMLLKQEMTGAIASRTMNDWMGRTDCC